MSAIVKIDEHEFAAPRLSGADILEMTRIGVLPEAPGFELVDGVLVKMAAQLGPHVKMVRHLIRALIEALPPKFAVSPAPSIFLATDTMLEPDICMFPDELESTDVRGPDILLAIEVSDSSRRYDLGKKRELYAQNGVAHLWVVDLVEGQLIRHSDPEGEAYLNVSTAPVGAAVDLPFYEAQITIPRLD